MRAEPACGRDGRRAAARGATLVEYLVVLGSIALAAMGAFAAFGGNVRGLLGWEGDCVRTFQCEGGSGYPTGAASPPDAPTPALVLARAREAFKELDDPAHPPTGARARELEATIEQAARTLADLEMEAWRARNSDAAMHLGMMASDANNLASMARERANQVAWAESSGVDDVVKGFVVDGAWGTVTGIWTAVTHPITTAEGLWNAVSHPIITYESVRDRISQAYAENPSRFAGAAVFEVVSIFVAPAKVAKAVKVADEAADAGTVSRVIAAADDLCPGGQCAIPPRRLGVGSDVLVPRTDGSISAGRIIAEGPDGKVQVEFPIGDGTVGTKWVDSAALTRAAPDLAAPRAMYAHLPAADRAALQGYQLRISVLHDSVADAIPAHLVNETPRGYPPGSTWHDVQGVYLPGERRIVLSVDETGRIINSGSINVIFHESAHALDDALGLPSRSDAFQAARTADFERAPPGSMLDSPYYKTVEEGGAQRLDGALSETYAEAYALYQDNKMKGLSYMEDTYPELYAFFEAQSARPLPPPPAAGQ